MGIKQVLYLLICSTVMWGCAEGHCRRQVDTPQAAQPVNAMPETPDKSVTQDHVLVYKYDGSLQCGMGKAIAPETMAKELHGISILRSSKRADGLMHIQVCGSPTGKANVFEIPAKDLKPAESKGFKKWAFE